MFKRLVFAAVVLASAMLLVLSASAAPPCTRGVSSVGPTVLANGKLVANPKPHTEVCLP